MRAGGPRPLMPSRACARSPIYLYWFSANFRPPAFAPRKCRYQVRRETPRATHGARSCSSGVPARRFSPERRPRAACRKSQPCWCPLGRAIVPCSGTQDRQTPRTSASARGTENSRFRVRAQVSRPSSEPPSASLQSAANNEQFLPVAVARSAGFDGRRQWAGRA